MNISPELVAGVLGGVLVSLLPFINRNLDKLTSSKGAKIGFIVVETIEALEDGRLTPEELDRILEAVRRYMMRLSSNGRKRVKPE